MRKKILLGFVWIMGLSILGGCHESIEGKTDELKQEGMIVTSETEKEKVITPISSEDVYGHYICEEPGFGGMFTVDISSDGFSYYAGASSSYFGTGSWELSENRLMLKDVGYGEEWDIFFTVEDACLIYDREASHPFLYVDLPDGTKFFNKENVDEAWLADLNERILESEREKVEAMPKIIEEMNKQREEALSHVNKFPFQGSDFQGLLCLDASMNQKDSSMPILYWIEDASGNKLWEAVTCREEGENNSYYYYEKEDGRSYIIEYNADTKYHFDMFSLDAMGSKIDELTYDVPDNTDRAGFNTEVKKYVMRENGGRSIMDMAITGY
ncbi:MAG: hypothetical protein IKO03_15180 [Lachnospiraceae bacterium]|nr:hypothetical protein [Lachnospiraceae bacterium]